MLATTVAAIAVTARATDVPFSTANTIEGDFLGAHGVHTADIDGDGDLDVVGAAYDADTITWWENDNGDATAWSEHEIDSSCGAPFCVYAGDVDGDGNVDVLGASYADDAIRLWRNVNGDGLTWAEQPVDQDFAEPKSVYAGDVDGDGDLDVLGASQALDEISWWENTNGDGTAWTEHEVDTDCVHAHSVYGADVDGDGDLDILGAAPGAHEITWWENNTGLGTSWSEHLVEGDFGAAQCVSAADVDGDGDMDVLGAADAGGITWWENDGTPQDGGWTEHTVDADFFWATCVCAADVDSDGDVDVLGAAYGADEIAWWENDGTPEDDVGGEGNSWTKHVLDAAFAGAWWVHVADVDGDGDLDVLGAAYDADDIAWWENQTIHRNATFPVESKHTVDGDFGWALHVEAADMDRDGDMDLVAAGGGIDQVAWWENPQPTSFPWQKRVVHGDLNGACCVHVADLDGDGDPDVLAGNGGTGPKMSSWWENVDGLGTNWLEKAALDDPVGGVKCFDTGDLDGDGDLDLVAAGEPWGVAGPTRTAMGALARARTSVSRTRAAAVYGLATWTATATWTLLSRRPLRTRPSGVKTTGPGGPGPNTSSSMTSRGYTACSLLTSTAMATWIFSGAPRMPTRWHGGRIPVTAARDGLNTLLPPASMTLGRSARPTSTATEIATSWRWRDT